MRSAPRVMILWCPDWPVIAAEIVEGIPAHRPVVVLHANRVVACSQSARAEGVRRGLRKREAQNRCPRLAVVEHDDGRDARAFEPVVAAVEAVVAGVEVIRPGMCALAARGPARYFGGEERAAEVIVERVAEACDVESQVGVAEGVFAAGLAARAGRLIPPGHTARFLAELDITVLDRPRLTDLLRRLGIRTLGDFATLPAGDVLSRFGLDAVLAHRLAAGQDVRPLSVRRPPPDLEATQDYDEPLERVDVAAFAARALAEKLHDRLGAYGLACTRLGIEAVTSDGTELHRVWRHDGLLTAAGIADRVRWQLDGWLSGTSRPRRTAGPTGDGVVAGSSSGGAVAGGAVVGGTAGEGTGRRGWSCGPSSGIVRLRLVPDGVLRQVGLQPGLWGEPGEERARAHRALSRVQGILGPESVVTAVVGGGRSPADRVRLVPWGDERVPARPGLGGATDDGDRVATGRGTAGRSGSGTGRPGRGGSRAPAAGRSTRDREREPPWPGRLPAPSPAAVLPEPVPAVVYDEDGEVVAVSARLEISAAPVRVGLGTTAPVEIVGWAGPWPVDERWWSPREANRRARFQIALADGRAVLLSLCAGRWLVEAFYD